MKKKEKVCGPLLGAHMSIAGGVDKALLLGSQIECDAIQIFTKSSRRWAALPYRQDEIRSFYDNRRRTGIGTVVAHDCYLFNLGCADATLRARSVRGFIDELERCETLGISLLIAHPGAHGGTGEGEGIRTIARSLSEIHAACPGFKAKIALEITAGQGTSIGYRFEHIRDIIEATRQSDRLRVCFDTQHAFAAGYDIRTREGYERTIAAFDRVVGLERLAAFHLNDSKTALDARVDRHEHIGKGQIGIEAFRYLLNDPRFWGLPMCLETPKGRDLAEDRENLALLRSLLPAGGRAGSGRNRNAGKEILHDRADRVAHGARSDRNREKLNS
ncbi:MAG TPA: deoxyribonuclease IV [Candidatus Eisenbacteria bacterium]|nr:deoxyribonuclease IV [Candidatus Eisenbacteria bacterium]